MQLDNGEVLTPEQSQALWDEVAAEKNGAAAKPPVESVKPEITTPEEKTEPAKAEPEPVADPLKEAVAKLEEKFEKRLRDINGHIGGLKDGQLKMQEMLAAATKAAAQVSDAPTQAQMNAAIGSKEKWDALQAQYPDWTQAFEHRLAQIPIPKIDATEIDKIVSERVKGESATVRKEIINTTLDAVYPGWEDEVRSEQFGKWLQSQPDWKPGFDDAKQLGDPESDLSKFIAANPGSPIAMYYSAKVGDAAKMLRLYESSKTAENAAANLVQQRQEVLNSASGAPKRGLKAPATKSVDDMSPQELWNYEAKLREQRRGRNY